MQLIAPATIVSGSVIATLLTSNQPGLWGPLTIESVIMSRSRRERERKKNRRQLSCSVWNTSVLFAWHSLAASVAWGPRGTRAPGRPDSVSYASRSTPSVAERETMTTGAFEAVHPNVSTPPLTRGLQFCPNLACRVSRPLCDRNTNLSSPWIRACQFVMWLSASSVVGTWPSARLKAALEALNIRFCIKYKILPHYGSRLECTRRARQ